MSLPGARSVAVTMSWYRMPPVMERSLRDDVKAAVFVLLGAGLGYLVTGADDPWLLVGSLIGVTIGIVGINVVRRVRRR
jgi:F0F1-type ATP synthase assembly protein I